MESVAGTQGRTERRHSTPALRILLADDDRDTVLTLSAILEAEGHVVHGVHTGAEALKAVSFFRPDAIVLDISVPGISGYGVAQAVRHSFTEIRRPLMIAISGKWKEQPDQRIAQQVGFDHYLVKPCDPDELLRLLAVLRPSASSI